MTFEEFFKKKKIDLDQLKLAEPVLYEEFRYDYSQMGEKSFDHTKKFWFNKLRKIYHLKPDPKPQGHKPEINSLASQAEPLDSPTIAEKPLYSPRFKPTVTTQPKPEVKEHETKLASKEISASDEPGASKPLPGSESASEVRVNKPAFKPRFKAGVTNKDSPMSNQPVPAADNTSTTPNAGEPSAKPAYKPRFKAAVIKQDPADTVPRQPPEGNKIESPPSSEEPVKPAYKPRFKPGMMNKGKPKEGGEET